MGRKASGFITGVMKFPGFVVIILVPVIMYLFMCRCDSIVNRIEFKLPFILLSVIASVFFLKKSRLMFAVLANIGILILFFLIRDQVHDNLRWSADSRRQSPINQLEEVGRLSNETTDGYFLRVDELTQPEIFVGLLTSQDGEVYHLVTQDNGREVLQMLNNKNDPFYLNRSESSYEEMQGIFKFLVGKKVKMVGQQVSGMRVNNQVAGQADHTTFNWIRVISVKNISAVSN